MNSIIKHFPGRPKSIVATACILYAFLFMTTGCKKDDDVRQPYMYIQDGDGLRKYHFPVVPGMALFEVKKPHSDEILAPNDLKLPDDIAKHGIMMYQSMNPSEYRACYDFFNNEYDRCWAFVYING